MKICAIPGCGRPASGEHRYCGAHASRWQKHKNFDTPKKKTPEDRFWEKVQKTETCWNWKGAADQKGYGRFGIKQGLIVLAHRFSYELLVGPIPVGLTLDHLCRNPSCVNPAHLEPVTLSENLRRSTFHEKAKEWQAGITHCPKGHLLSGDNLYLHNGHRHCIKCDREATRVWRAKNKAEQNHPIE